MRVLSFALLGGVGAVIWKYLLQEKQPEAPIGVTSEPLSEATEITLSL